MITEGVFSLNKFKLTTAMCQLFPYQEPQLMHKMIIPFHGCFVPEDYRKEWPLR